MTLEFVQGYDGNPCFHRLYADDELYVAYNGKALSDCIGAVNELARQQ